MITVKVSGSFKNTTRFLQRMKNRDHLRGLAKYGPVGVTALSGATSVDTGDTAHSWSYEIIDKPGSYTIVWTNTNVEGGVPVAVLLQYGHGTGTGGFVQGRDYINPAMRPVFDKMAADMWKEVTR